MKILANLIMLFDLINKKRHGEFSLDEAKDDQTKSRSDMGEIKKVRKKYFSK